MRLAHILKPFAIGLVCAVAQGQQMMTANAIAKNLNDIGFTYETLTNLANNLKGKLGSDPKAAEVVKQYQDLTDAETSEQGPGQPLKPFDPIEQYAIEEAAHSLDLEDRRFLFALQNKRRTFSHKQARQIRGLLKIQLQVIGGFDDIESDFGPRVGTLTRDGDKVLNETVRETIEVFS